MKASSQFERTDRRRRRDGRRPRSPSLPALRPATARAAGVFAANTAREWGGGPANRGTARRRRRREAATRRHDAARAFPRRAAQSGGGLRGSPPRSLGFRLGAWDEGAAPSPSSEPPLLGSGAAHVRRSNCRRRAPQIATPQQPPLWWTTMELSTTNLLGRRGARGRDLRLSVRTQRDPRCATRRHLSARSTKKRGSGRAAGSRRGRAGGSRRARAQGIGRPTPGEVARPARP